MSGSEKKGTKSKCVFNESLQKEYPFFAKRNNPHSALCTQCNSEISIASGGKPDIKINKNHFKSKKHLNAVSAIATNTSLNKFFTSNASQNNEVIAKEAVIAYHTVKHNHSFRSLDCTSKLMSCLFGPKFSSARTKSETIVKHVLAHETQRHMFEELAETSYLSIMVDSSNHGSDELV